MFTLEASTTIVGNEFHISQTRLTKNTYFCIHSRLTLEQFMSVTPCYTILIEYKIGWAMDSDIVMNNLITITRSYFNLLECRDSNPNWAKRSK